MTRLVISKTARISLQAQLCKLVRPLQDSVRIAEVSLAPSTSLPCSHWAKQEHTAQETALPQLLTMFLDSHHQASVNAAAAAAAADATVVSIPFQAAQSFQRSFASKLPHILPRHFLPVAFNLTKSVYYRMPASGTAAAPFGRFMSGRGVASVAFSRIMFLLLGSFPRICQRLVANQI